MALSTVVGQKSRAVCVAVYAGPSALPMGRRSGLLARVSAAVQSRQAIGGNWRLRRSQRQQGRGCACGQ